MIPGEVAASGPARLPAVDATARPTASGHARPQHTEPAGDALRTARLLLAPELEAGTLRPGQLAAAAGARGLRTRPVPPAPVRLVQRLRRRRGGLGHLDAVATPLDAIRREALGGAAAGPPRFLVRVDEFPHYRAWDEPERYGTERFRRFHAILAEAGVPYLIAAPSRVSRAPLDPAERAWRPLDDGEAHELRAIVAAGTTLALHGRDHRTRSADPRRHSELCGLGAAATAALLDGALAELAALGLDRPEVFVPPFNRFDAAQLPLLAERFPIVCGGPETVGLLGFQRSPQWRSGTVYLPSYAPLYGRAREVLPAARAMVEAQQALWAPITLHWGWEADEEWTALSELVRAIAPYATRWERFLTRAREERAAAGGAVS
jgi:Uncharacterized protein conserved in bacteria (DUF2334)